VIFYLNNCFQLREVAQNWELNNGKVKNVLVWAKNGLGYILGDFVWDIFL
jgi:hypothetical protein